MGVYADWPLSLLLCQGAHCSSLVQLWNLLTTAWALAGWDLIVSFSVLCKDCKGPVNQLLHNSWRSEGSIWAKMCSNFSCCGGSTWTAFSTLIPYGKVGKSQSGWKRQLLLVQWVVFKSLRDSFLTQVYSKVSKALTVHPHMQGGRRQNIEEIRACGVKEGISLFWQWGALHALLRVMSRESYCTPSLHTHSVGRSKVQLWSVQIFKFSTKTLLNSKHLLCGSYDNYGY